MGKGQMEHPWAILLGVFFGWMGEGLCGQPCRDLKRTTWVVV